MPPKRRQFAVFKFRRKLVVWLCLLVALKAGAMADDTDRAVPGRCGDSVCVNGQCIDGNCTCYAGWRGPGCQLCGGRVRLTQSEGVITHGIGNYSTDMQCTWLVDGSTDNRSVQLYIDDFATECGWDHVYIFDGDNVYSNLLAVYSGMVQLDHYANHNYPSLEARSGSAYIHFYSDAAYNMTGFKISYKYNSCPSVSSSDECSGHGACDRAAGVCSCDVGWGGSACHLAHCPNGCGAHGSCSRQLHRCVCQPGYRGADCGYREDLGYWELLPPSEYVPPGRASHASVVKGDSIWLLGGEAFTNADFVVRYDINGGVWEPFHTRGSQKPLPRYGHSAVLRGDNVYMYGGVVSSSADRRGVPRPPPPAAADAPPAAAAAISSELWALDTSTRHWERLHVKPAECHRDVCGPLAVAGHTALLTDDDRMLVLFGHSPVYGYLNYVQVYHFGRGSWRVHSTRGGALVKGSYGHSSVWDADSRRVFVYGGHLSDTIATYSLSSLLHALDTDTMQWYRLSPSGSARFLHSAVMLNGLMVVFGGNTHNDTSYSQGAHCYSQSLLAYDPACDRWHQLTRPHRLRLDAARYGHTAVLYAGSMYAVAGYNGRMLSDVLRFQPGRCDAFGSLKSCLASALGSAVKCAWNRKLRLCEPYTRRITGKTHAVCDVGDDMVGPSAAALCAAITSCPTCLHSAYDCVWCGMNCSYKKCKDLTKPITVSDQCQPNHSSNCNLLHNCHACHTEPYCKWEHDHKCYTYIEKRENRTEMAMKIPQEPCGPSCSERTSCENCTAANCMWCINEMRCVENNAYVVSFPYGQCMEWTTLETKCDAVPPGGTSCNAHQTCERCQEDPGCGWCDSGSGTGLGRCLRGGFSGPISHNCPAKLWNFLSCPPCQCNGHSACYPGNSTCQPCGDLTTGDHCDSCRLGYYGDPVNGGHCQLCDCNNHGTDCHPETGRCYCDTKGIIGDKCDRCDTLNKFLGDPSVGEECFYKLALDYQFTFNMTKPEDLHFKRINFMNQPLRSDLNTDFHITCSEPAKLNITVKSLTEPEQVVLADFNCTQHEHTFSQSEFSFGTPDNTTFYVYVYQLQPPLFVQVAFSQHPRLNLRQFFITFSTCFLLLLVIAALLWKIKQKIDNYRRRQRLFVEMEQMASRPYAQVVMEIDRRCGVVAGGGDSPVGAVQPGALFLSQPRQRHRTVPSAVALEQCAGNRAALLTVLIECPTGGGKGWTPAGLSGIVTGTALVADGTSRKNSSDVLSKSEKRSHKVSTPTDPRV